MPIATRRRAQGRNREQGEGEQVAIAHIPDEIAAAVEAASMEIGPDEGMEDEDEEEEGEEGEEEGEEVEVGDDEDGPDHGPSFAVSHDGALTCGIEVDDEDEGQEIFPPPGLKEISSLASWTVSTAKPGNGVAALRSPDLSHFWQSDGPQPHLLSIHFFKRVSIVHMRIFLDFGNDESYTPTKIQFLAGMSLHDMQEFAEMSFDQPQGWKDVDFSTVGRPEDYEESSEDEDDESGPDWSRRPVLRAFVVQVRILENHQNGKDTHLRSVQIFAKDEMQLSKPLLSTNPTRGGAVALAERRKLGQGKLQAAQDHMKPSPWMLEPDLR